MSFTLDEVEEAVRIYEASCAVPTPAREVSLSSSSSMELPARQASSGELLTHATSSENLLGKAEQHAETIAPPVAASKKLDVRVKGTAMSVRADPPRLRAARCPVEEPVQERLQKRLRTGDRGIGKGREAAACGIHPYTDIGDLFLEFVYQDLPDLLLRDADAVGVTIVSPVAERARLLAKSGEVDALETALRSAATATWVETAREAQKVVAHHVAVAQTAGRLSVAEAEELRRTLELEVNLEFGARHEDAAVEAYEIQSGRSVYGQQRRVSLPLPKAGAAEALAHTLPPMRDDPLPQDGPVADEGISSGDAYFLLTGFVDGLVDIPRKDASGLQTAVVEVKHRMGKIRDPPNIYDVVQLASYCRVFGLVEGVLVQCLREELAGGDVGQLHVMPLDFSEGSTDRKGWDEHVLPGLYKMAAAVYAARADEATRYRLLAAGSPEERASFVAELCPHLGR